MVNEELLRFFGQLEGLMQMTIKDVEKIEKNIEEIHNRFHDISVSINSIDSKLDKRINSVNSKVDSWINKLKGAWWAIGVILGLVGTVVGFLIKILLT